MWMLIKSLKIKEAISCCLGLGLCTEETTTALQYKILEDRERRLYCSAISR